MKSILNRLGFWPEPVDKFGEARAEKTKKMDDRFSKSGVEKYPNGPPSLDRMKKKTKVVDLRLSDALLKRSIRKGTR